MDPAVPYPSYLELLKTMQVAIAVTTTQSYDRNRLFTLKIDNRNFLDELPKSGHLERPHFPALQLSVIVIFFLQYKYFEDFIHDTCA